MHLKLDDLIHFNLKNSLAMLSEQLILLKIVNLGSKQDKIYIICTNVPKYAVLNHFITLTLRGWSAGYGQNTNLDFFEKKNLKFHNNLFLMTKLEFFMSVKGEVLNILHVKKE